MSSKLWHSYVIINKVFRERGKTILGHLGSQLEVTLRKRTKTAPPVSKRSEKAEPRGKPTVHGSRSYPRAVVKSSSSKTFDLPEDLRREHCCSRSPHRDLSQRCSLLGGNGLGCNTVMASSRIERQLGDLIPMQSRLSDK